MVVLVGETTLDPEVAVLVVQRAEQYSVLFEVHVNVEELPEIIDAGLAERVTVGFGTGSTTVTCLETAAFPPGPVQLM